MGRKLPKIIEKGTTGLFARSKCPRGFHAQRDPRFLPYVVGPDLFVRNGYRAEVCTGEAHSNAHIDNCMRCAPMWGVCAVKVAL